MTVAIRFALSDSLCSGQHNLGRDDYLKKSYGRSQEEQKENIIPIESRVTKRKCGNGPEPTERAQKSRKLPLDHINVLPVIKSTCRLSRLPIELLDVIFQKLHIEYVFLLSLQTRYFWNIARRHIQACCASSCGPWAGQGIICIGEYLEPADYPPNVLTESEKEELKRGLKESEIWDDVSSDEGSTNSVSCPINFYSLADARYQQVREWQYRLVERLIGSASLLGEWHRLPTSRRTLIFHELPRYKLIDFYPEDQSWILRNLTTQEYVRSEAIAIKLEYIHGPNIDVLGFGEVVWSRVCWSTETDCSMDYADNLHRGLWAGHRFDITTLNRHKQGSLEGAE